MINESQDRFERDQERLRRIREAEERAEPTYKSKASRVGTCLVFVVLLAVAGLIAVYALTHRDQVRSILQRGGSRPPSADTTPVNGI